MALIIALSTLSAILLVTILLLSYYTRLRRTPYYVLLTGMSAEYPTNSKGSGSFLAMIGWFIPFSIVLLLPIDLASTTAERACQRDPEDCTRPLFYLDETTLLLCWRIGYWTTFALTWYDSTYSTSNTTLGQCFPFYKPTATQVIVPENAASFPRFVKISATMQFS